MSTDNSVVAPEQKRFWVYLRSTEGFLLFIFGCLIAVFISRLVLGSNEILAIEASPILRLSYFAAIGITSLFGLFMALRESKSQARVERKLEAVEQLAREHPEKSQLAWELAQTKLESYLNRNLNQVRSIYWLTLVVMGFGFLFIGYGVSKSLDSPVNFPVGLLSAISGVLISFIGGSFLLIFKSTTEQARAYVAVLERINAVGMCVQILDTIPNEHADLKYQSRANVALQLLKIYSLSNEKKTAKKTDSKKTPAF